MFQDQHAQHHFRWRLAPATSSALRTPLALGIVNRAQEFVILQQFVNSPHPGLPEFLYFLGEKGLPQTRLLVAQSDHVSETIQNRIRLFCFELRTSSLGSGREEAAILHREVA
jgi:hypothetical protein